MPHNSIARAIWGALDTVFSRPDWFKKVNITTLKQDAFAGLTGATIVLPQAVAFANIAGLPPQYGFYTAMITPIVAAFLGSSWHSVSGPTTAISALIFGALSGLYEVGSYDFFQAAVVMALIVGVIQLALGLAKLGALVNFVSHSVMTGFIAGATLLIVFSQLKHAFGLDLPRPEHMAEFFVALFNSIDDINIVSLTIASGSLLTAIAVKMYLPSWPNYLIALAVGTGLYSGFGTAASSVATIGTIDSVIPVFSLPAISVQYLRELASPALAIALVGLLEASSVGGGIAMRSGQNLDSNREFTGQGMSNIVGSFFNCYPGSASFTRSGVNYDAGAQTPLSAIFAAVLLFVILLTAAPFFAYVPIPAMAGVIIMVAWKLINIKAIRHLIEVSRAETAIAAITLTVALFVELEFAIYCGVLLSIVMFLDRSSHPVLSIGAPDPNLPRHSFRPAFKNNLAQCPQLMSVGLDGPLFFGSVNVIRREFRRFEQDYPEQVNMIFVVRGAGQLDMPAAELLIEEADRRRARGGNLYIQTKIERTIKQLELFGVTEHLGNRKVHLSKGDAISGAFPTLDNTICTKCTTRIFSECSKS